MHRSYAAPGAGWLRARSQCALADGSGQRLLQRVHLVFPVWAHYTCLSYESLMLELRARGLLMYSMLASVLPVGGSHVIQTLKQERQGCCQRGGEQNVELRLIIYKLGSMRACWMLRLAMS